MNFESYISYRYLTAKKERFLTFLNFVSITGVAIGVTALIVVLSVMTGFGNNIRDKIIGTTPHLMIEKETGVKDYTQIIDQLQNTEGVVGLAAYVQGSLFLEEESKALSLVLRGVDPSREETVTKVHEYLKEGKLADLTDETVIIGKELATYFGYGVGDEITLISPGSGIAGEAWRYRLKVVGIFDTGMVDYDMNLIITNIQQAQTIFHYPENYASGVGVRLKDPYQAKEIKERIYGVLGFSFLVKSWIDINRNLFDALFLEKWGLFIILTLMILVASFNIISTLIVTVTSKIHDIGVLKSIGATKRSIRKIFMKQGIYIGMLGTFWGMVFGLGICYILSHYIQVPKEIYSIDRVPVDLQWSDIAAIISSALIISYLATLYPAAKAAALEPVEALRYE